LLLFFQKKKRLLFFRHRRLLTGCETFWDRHCAMSQSAQHPFLESSNRPPGGTRRVFRALVLDGPRAAWLDCLALLVAAGAIRMVGLPGLPLWSDELFTVFWSQLPIDYLFGAGAGIDATPPFYYALMHGWISLFGDSPLAVRLPSWLFSSATVPLVYLTAARLFDRKIALLAGVFAAVNPFAVMYAQEARCYALLGWVDAAALFSLAVWLRRRNLWGEVLLPWLALFGLAVSAGVFLHYTSVFFMAACFAVAAFDLGLSRPYQFERFALWSVLLLFAGGCAADQLWQASQLFHDSRLAWIPAMTPAVAANFLLAVMSDPQQQGWVTWLSCVLLAAAATGARGRVWRREAWLLLAVLPVLFCVLLFGASLVRPVAIPRVGLWLTMPLCILLAACVTGQRSGWLRGAAAVAVLAAWLVPLAHYVAKPGKEDWRTAALIAARQPGCDGPVMYVDNSGLGLVYYQPELAQRPLFTLSLTKVQGGFAPVPIAVKQQDILQQTYLHPNYIYLRQVPAFLAANPHTALVLLPGYEPVLGVLPAPKLAGRLAGGLTMACY
jgi:4-amino-4-deoxy-L-arabinose transferase-like glycosyltransferase